MKDSRNLILPEHLWFAGKLILLNLHLMFLMQPVNSSSTLSSSIHVTYTNTSEYFNTQTDHSIYVMANAMPLTIGAVMQNTYTPKIVQH